MPSQLEENADRKYDRVPSDTLVELHFRHSARRHVRRHNEYILKMARRRQRRKNLLEFVRITGVTR